MSNFSEATGREVKVSETDKNYEGGRIDISELDKPLYTKEANEGGSENKNDTGNGDGTKDKENTGLSDEEKQKIKEETGWSDEIIDAIRNMDEYQVYKNAGLKEMEIDGKKCLIRTDIDMDQKDSMGRTNRERMEQGLAPITKDGKTVELHHIGQKSDSPLAELTTEEHRGKGNDTILHDKDKESEIDRNTFNGEKEDHWKARAEGSDAE